MTVDIDIFVGGKYKFWGILGVGGKVTYNTTKGVVKFKESLSALGFQGSATQTTEGKYTISLSAKSDVSGAWVHPLIKTLEQSVAFRMDFEVDEEKADKFYSHP